MNDFHAVAQNVAVGRLPWHVGVDEKQQIGLTHVFGRLRTEIERMIRREIHVAQLLHHRNREQLGELYQVLHRFGIAAEIFGDDQRTLGGDQPFRRFLQRRLIRLRLTRGRQRVGRQQLSRLDRFGQPLPRQGHVNRPAWLAHADLVGARHHRGEILIGPHFIVPLDELAHDVALIARLLAPVNVLALAAAQLALSDRRSAGNQEQRHVARCRIDDAAERVSRAGQSMHQNHLRFLRHVVITMRHRNCRLLVRHDNWLNITRIFFRGPRHRLDQRAVIGAGIGKHVAHRTKFLHLRQKSFGAARNRNGFREFLRHTVPF